jgi:hypothetical protein
MPESLSRPDVRKENTSQTASGRLEWRSSLSAKVEANKQYEEIFVPFV